MPAILDLAIGMFFVFMLFSIVVTALNELVLTFFDKRADFLRLGLGELLHDSQKDVVNGYASKVIKYASNGWQWVLTWIAGVPVVMWFFEAEGRSIALAVGLVSVVLALHKGLTKYGPVWLRRDGLGKTLARKLEEVCDGIFKKQGAVKNARAKNAGAKGAAKESKEIRVKDIFRHPLIFSLSKGESDPSYIRAGSFSKAMLDELVPALDDAGPPSFDKLKAEIEKLGNEKLRVSLAALLQSVGNDAEDAAEKFKKALEEWFEHSMERVTGWYKRHAQTWLMILSFGLAAVCNVDALRIIRTLSTNPNLAKAVTAQAESFAKTSGQPASKEVIDAARDAKDKKIKEAEKRLEEVKAAMAAAPQRLMDATTALNAAAGDEAKKTAQAVLDKITQEMNPQNLLDAQAAHTAAVDWDGALADFHADLQKLRDSGIPMGWSQAMVDEFGILKNPLPLNASRWQRVELRLDKWNWDVVFPALCGWGLMALAASLGAPFWFDMLQRVMNLRANGRAPDEKALGTKKEKVEVKEEEKSEAANVSVSLRMRHGACALWRWGSIPVLWFGIWGEAVGEGSG